jgi:hypothetical protein
VWTSSSWLTAFLGRIIVIASEMSMSRVWPVPSCRRD